MGIRSDVAVAVSAKALRGLSDDTLRWMEADSNSRSDCTEGSFFLFTDIKWYWQSDKDIKKLYEELAAVDSAEYLVIEACHDYPSSEEGDRGDWLDNPWNIRRCVRVEISWCEPT